MRYTQHYGYASLSPFTLHAIIESLALLRQLPPLLIIFEKSMSIDTFFAQEKGLPGWRRRYARRW